MVRPIIVTSEDKTFYGTRWAFYDLPLETKNDRKLFLNELQSGMIKINKSLWDSGNGLHFKISEKKRAFKPEQTYEGTKIPLLEGALFDTPNIQIYTDEFMIANLISQFSSKEESEKRPRGLEIISCPIPNEIIKFDPSFLYDLGNRYGRLIQGTDYDLSLTNFREIRNER